MMVIRECVRRFGRMPQIVVVDGGIEFSGVYFETLLARYECTKKTRPPAAARFGSVCERLFGVANSQFVHNLQGNTQITRQVRQVTKSVNPQNHAVWTLERLYQYLCLWAYEIYDTLAHPALSQSPREAYAAGTAHSGQRPHRLIPYDADFRIFTLPTTSKGAALMIPGLGVKINSIYYWNDSFRSPDVERTRVEVRFDPCDAGAAWAFVSHHWVECFSEHYAVFHQRSERELMIASQELRRRKGLHSKQFRVTAARLAQFLESVESEEALLRQRLADCEARAGWKMINGGQIHCTDEIITLRDLERRALSVAQCARMLSEAVDGERKLTQSTDAKQELRKNLGLTVEMKSRPHSSNDTSLDATASQAAAKSKRRRIGQRNPSRDEIGAKRA